jgi:hypothetical protein
MSRLVSSSETVFEQPAEKIYDFVTNPVNWPLTYPGSTGVEGVDGTLEVGDTWGETALLDSFECRFDWRVITAVRPRMWAFQSIGNLAQNADGTGGFEGIHTVEYSFTDAGGGATLFRRTMTMELPKGGRMHRAIVLAYEPVFTDEYHAAVAKHL